jgi:hypothetical protein
VISAPATIPCRIMICWIIKNFWQDSSVIIV